MATCITMFRDGLIVTAVFLINVLSDGIGYSFAILYTDLMRSFGASSYSTSGIGSVNGGILCFVGPIASRLVDGIGCRAVTVLSGATAALGYLLSTFSPSIVVLYLTIGAIAGFGSGFVYIGTMVYISTYFDKQLPLATGIASCGGNLGAFVFPIICRRLLLGYGWRGTVLIFSALLLNISVFGILFAPVRRGRNGGNGEDDDDVDYLSDTVAKLIETQSNSEDKTRLDLSSPQETGNLETDTPEVRNHADEHEHDIDTTLELERSDTSDEIVAPFKTRLRKYVATKLVASYLSLLKDSKFVILTLSCMVAVWGLDVPIYFVADMAEGFGIDTVDAAWIYSSIGLAKAFGGLFYGWASQHLRAKFPSANLWLYLVSVTLAGVLTIIMPYCTTITTLMTSSVLFGFFTVAVDVITILILIDLLGVARLPDALGWNTLVCGLSCILSPPVAGRLYDVTGDYTASFIMAGVCLVVSGLAIVPLLVRGRTRTPVL